MIADLVVETFQRTDAAGSRRGVRVAWTPPPDTEVVVRWHYRADPAPWGDWQQSEPIRGSSFEVLPAAPGRYQFHVFDQQPDRPLIDWGVHEIDVGPLLESELELPKPSGLELVGPSGELLGSAGVFVGRDLRLRWNAVRLDALYTDGAGEAPDDGLIEFAEVRVVGPGGELLRAESVPVHQTEWTYSYARNAEDQPLTIDPASAVRDVRLEVRWKDRTGRLGNPAVLEVEHTLQLSATGDLETSAATAVTSVEDLTENDLGLTGAFDTYLLLDELEITGEGWPVQIQFTDRCTWFWLFTSPPGSYVEYRLRVLDEADAVIVETSMLPIEWWADLANSRDIYAQPNLTVRALLEAGEEYRAQVHIRIHGIRASSFERRWLLTDLKR